VTLAEPLGQGSPGWGHGGSDAGDLVEQGDAGATWQRVSNEVREEGKQKLAGAALSTQGAPKEHPSP